MPAFYGAGVPCAGVAADTVYLVWFTVDPLPGCKVVPDAFDPELECALRAPSPEAARERLERALRRHRYALAEVQACLAYDPAAEAGERVAAAAVRALGTDEPVYGSFGPSPRSGP